VIDAHDSLLGSSGRSKAEGSATEDRSGAMVKAIQFQILEDLQCVVKSWNITDLTGGLKVSRISPGRSRCAAAASRIGYATAGEKGVQIDRAHQRLSRVGRC
jgi:hypothetical protein